MCRIHREGARDARDRRAAARQGEADRYRLRLHEVLRHRVGDDADQPVPGARRLHRLAAELHERGDDRRAWSAGARRWAASPAPSPSICASRAMCAAPPARAATKHTVFRTGEVHGRSPIGCRRSAAWSACADSAMVTENLWGERWSKLVTNVMGNGLSACTGHDRQGHGAERSDPAFSARGSAARRSASARRSAMSWRRSTISIPRSSPAPAKATRRPRGL